MNCVVYGREHNEDLRVLFGVVGVEVNGLFCFHETHSRITNAEAFLRVGNADIRRDDDVGSELLNLLDDFFRVDGVGNAFVD